MSVRSVLDPAVRQGPGQVTWAICAPISKEHQQSLQVRYDSGCFKPDSQYGSVGMTMQHSCRLRADVDQEECREVLYLTLSSALLRDIASPKPA